MQDPRVHSEFRERVREQLTADWKKHPELEWASLDQARDGDVLVGATPKMDKTTFCGDELLIDAVITGLRVKGGRVHVNIAGKLHIVDGDMAFKRPLFVQRGDKIRVTVHGKVAGEIRFSMHGYELAASMVVDAKRAVAELLEAS